MVKKTYEPARGGHLRATARSLARRSRRLVAVMLLAIVAVTVLGAVVVPMVAPTSATAETRLVVGDQTLGAQAVPGYASATVTLAETYARFVSDDTLRGKDSNTSTVTASVIPDNPVIRLRASADDDSTALAAAKQASGSLINVVRKVSTTDVASARKDFLEHQREYVEAQTAADDIKAEMRSQADPGSDLQARSQQAEIDAELARLEASSAGSILQNRITANAGNSTALTVIQPPEIVSNQRNASLLGGLAGLSLSVLIAGAVVIVLEARRSGDVD